MISVVIPLFNKAETIERSIKSILKQSFKDFEIVIVDDGSTDGSVDVVKTNFDSDKIIIYSQKNQGVSIARNNGVDHAKYKYIAFLDADDYWEPDYLQFVMQSLKENPAAGMICSGGYVINPGISKALRLPSKFKSFIGEIDFFQNPHVFVHTSATVVSKDVFYKAGGFPAGMKRNQDFALFFSIALITPVIYIGFPLSNYVGGVNGQATSTPVQKVLNHVINRFNHVKFRALHLDVDIKTKKQFDIFNEYELRHIILGRLKLKDYLSIKTLLKGLNDENLSDLFSFEKFLYAHPQLRSIAIGWIYSTKVIWRFRGYPIVGRS